MLFPLTQRLGVLLQSKKQINKQINKQTNQTKNKPKQNKANSPYLHCPGASLWLTSQWLAYFDHCVNMDLYVKKIYINFCLSIKYRQFRKRRYFIWVMWHQNTVYLNKKARIPRYQNPLPSLKKRREKQEQKKKNNNNKTSLFQLLLETVLHEIILRNPKLSLKKEGKKEKRKQKTPSYPVS